MSDTSGLIGRIFDSRYQITALVGRGGMGTVYKAVHVAMNQTVALKVLHREMSRDERQVQRFYQEARASSRLKHPNTIRVFDFGRSDEGHLYFAMEFLEGETLTQLLRREGALPVRRALNIVRQVAKALAEAHMNGLVHRDLKPDNIFITQIYGEQDFVKVLDFGIAKFIQGNPEYGALTQAGVVCGTPLYLSPEQALGRTLDGRSDLYSLGVILYEMLAGVPPFRAETPVALVMRHIHDEPPPLGPEAIPEPVRALVFSLLDKDRDRRPASAEALVGLIDAAMASAPATIRPVAAGPSVSQPVESARTRIEAIRPAGLSPERPSQASFPVAAPIPPPPEEALEGATQALPFAPPPIPAAPARLEREAPVGPAVDRDAPTVYLSRSAAGLAGQGSRQATAAPEEEETVVVSLSDSRLVQPLAAAGPSQVPAARSTGGGPVSGPDDSTRIEPPSVVSEPRRVTARPRSSRRRATRVLVVGLVMVTAGVAGVGVAALIQGHGGGEATSERVASNPGPVEVGGSPERTPQRAASEVGTVAGASVTAGVLGGGAQASGPPAPAEPARPRQASVTLESTPPGATVFLGDRKVGTTPVVLTVREGDGPAALRFVADGFEEAHLTVDPAEVIRSGLTTRRVALERKPEGTVRAEAAGASAEAARPAPRVLPQRPKRPARPAAPKKPAPALNWE